MQYILFLMYYIHDFYALRTSLHRWLPNTTLWIEFLVYTYRNAKQILKKKKKNFPLEIEF